MAIIYSYPLYAPKPEDLLIGTVTLDENAAVPIYDNPTVSFTIQSIVDLIAPVAGLQNLQSVTTVGATTTNTVTFSSDIKVTGRIYDSGGGAGANGEILSSLGTGTAWINNTPGGVTKIIAGDRITINPTSGLGDVTITADIQGGAVTSFKADSASSSYLTMTPTTASTGAVELDADLSAVNGATATTTTRFLSVDNKWEVPIYTGAGVTTLTSVKGTYINITNNAAADGAVGLGTVDLNAQDDNAGTTSTRFLTKTNKWEVPSYTTNTNTTYDYLAIETIPTFTIVAGGGSGYTPISSTVVNVATTGGSGTGLTVDITIDATGSIILPSTVNNPGSGYAIGEVLTITGGTATITLAGSVGNVNPNLRLIDNAFGFDDIKLTGTNATTVTRTSNTGITINSDHQTLRGTGSDNSDSGIILNESGGTVLVLGDGSVTAAQTGNTITLTGVNTKLTTIITNSGTVSTGVPLTGSINAAGEVLTIESNYFGGGSNVGYVPASVDNTQFLKGDGTWSSIPTGLNYQGIWAASTTAEVATQSGTNLTIVTADASLIVGTIVEGTGTSGTIKIATVTDSSTFVLDTSVTVSAGTILTMSAPGGAPVLTGTSLQGDGILYICTVAGKAYPNNFRSTNPITTPGDWNVGDWCVFTGVAGVGEWTRIPATTAGVTSATTADGSFIEYSPALSGSAGAITIGADLSAGGTASGTTFLRGDNQWAVPGGTGVTSITGQEPITVVTTGGPTATTPRIDLRYADSSAAADDNVVTACPEGEGTIILTGSDTLLINDATEGSGPAVLNVVREFSLDRLKAFMAAGDITGVAAGSGLSGGGSAGDVTLNVEYDTDGNVILESFSGDFVAVTTVGGATTQTQLQFSAANIAKIKPGMVAGTTALGTEIGTVSSSTGTTVTFTANLGVTIGTGANVNFSSVITSSSQLMFNAGTGASISEFVSHKALSTVDLNLFDTSNLPGSVVFTPAILTPLTIGIKGQVPAPPTTTASNPTGYFLRSNATWGHAISSLLTGDGLKGGPISQSGTVSVEYSGELIFNTPLDNVITSANSLIIPGGDYIDTTDLILISDTTNSISATSNGAVTAGAAVTLTVDDYTPTGINIEAGLNIYDASGANTYYGVVTAASARLSFTCNLDTDIADGVDLIFRNNTEVKKALVSQLPFVPSGTSFISTVTADNGLKIGGTSSNPIVEASYTKAEFEVNVGGATNQKTFTLTIALTGIGGATVKNIAGQIIGVVDSVSGFTVTCVANLAFAVADGEMLTFSTKPKNLITAATTTALGILDADELLVLNATSGLVERKPVGDLPSPAASSNYYLNAIARTSGTNTVVFTVKDRPGTAPSFTFGANAFNSTTIPSAASVFTGVTACDTTPVAGTSGLVPIPTINDCNKFLKSDGSWTVLPVDPDSNTTYSIDVPASTTNINLKGSDGTNDAITLTQSTGISITNNNVSQLTFANTGVVSLNVPNTGPGEGGISLTGSSGAIDISVDYLGGENVISTAYAGSGTIPTTAHIMWAEITGVKKVYYSDVADLPFASSSASGTVTSISASNDGVLVSASTTTPTVGVNYGAAGVGGTNLILGATDKTGVTPQGSDLILISDTVNSVLEYYELSDVPGFNKEGTVTSVAALTLGTTGTDLSSTVAGGSGSAVITLQVPSASAANRGALTAADWTTFNNKTSNTGTVTGVTGTAPVVSSEGTAPAISMAKATASVDGYLSSTDWSTFNGKTSNTGTVTSITLAAGSGSGTALTTSGTFTFTAGTNVSTSVSGTTVTINSTDQYVGTVTGTGTANYVSKWSTGSNQVNSVLRDDGTGVAIGNTPDADYRMLIEGAVSGYKHIGTGNGDVGFYTKNEGTATANILYQADANIGGSNTTVFTVISSGTLEVKGDIVAFGSPSDKRLKENIKPIESALDKAMKLQGVTFDWKEKDGKILDLKEDIGFIAQDVQKIIPELVRENENGILSMRHQGVAPILLEAIKELKQEIEELKLNKCNCNCNK